jgi:hypothetical protein
MPNRNPTNGNTLDVVLPEERELKNIPHRNPTNGNTLDLCFLKSKGSFNK